MRYAAIIVAAGRGTRAGGDVSKQWQTVAGRAVAVWTLARFAGADMRVLVVHPDDAGHARALFADQDIRIVGFETPVDFSASFSIDLNLYM